MKSIRCPHCGLLNWATEELCKRCQLSLHGDDAVQDAPPDVTSYSESQGGFQSEPAPQWQFGDTSGYQQAAYAFPGYTEKPKKSGIAIASMTMGIISILACGLLGLGSVTALVLGIVALVKAKNRPMEYGGQGFAVAGIALSFVSFIFIGIVVSIAIPNFYAAKRAANEAATIRSLHVLSNAEEVFQSTTGNGRYGTLQELAAEGLLDESLSRGMKYQYLFEVRAEGSYYEVLATPSRTADTGSRSFYLSSEEQVVRGAKKGGIAATAYDPPIDSDRSLPYKQAYKPDSRQPSYSSEY
jgi:type II secretory pathway pseudopilin PulG